MPELTEELINQAFRELSQRNPPIISYGRRSGRGGLNGALNIIEEDEPKETDPDSKVKLRDGTTAKAKKCCKVRGYWYLLTDKQVLKDDFTGEYTISGYECSYIKDFKDNTPIYGITDVNNIKNKIEVIVPNKYNSFVLDFNLISKTNLVEAYQWSGFTSPDNPKIKKVKNNKSNRD